jgi:hypothetical protein
MSMFLALIGNNLTGRWKFTKFKVDRQISLVFFSKKGYAHFDICMHHGLVSINKITQKWFQ